MSRTYRRKRPQMRLGTLSRLAYRSGNVRDGTPTHASAGCQRHGSCDYCERNRLHGSRRREPIAETTEHTC